MTSMLVQVIVAFWLLLFGAMAIVPFLLDTKTTSHTVHHAAEREDRVISILPMGTNAPKAEVQTPASILAAANARAQATATRNNHAA